MIIKLDEFAEKVHETFQYQSKPARISKKLFKARKKIVLFIFSYSFKLRGHERHIREIATRFSFVAISWKFFIVSPIIVMFCNMWGISFYENGNNQERTQWIILWFSKRRTEGAYYHTFSTVEEDPEGFRNYAKLDILSFETLFEMQQSSLLKKDTVTVTAIFHIKTNYVQNNAFSLVQNKYVRRFLSQERWWHLTIFVSQYFWVKKCLWNKNKNSNRYLFLFLCLRDIFLTSKCRKTKKYCLGTHAIFSWTCNILKNLS